jgi:AcrR family transcriptional regulator
VAEADGTAEVDGVATVFRHFPTKEALIEEVYLLIRALAQATATMPTSPDVLDRAIDVLLAGLSTAATPMDR